MYLLPTPRQISINKDKFYILDYDSIIRIDVSCDIEVNHYGKILKDDIYKHTGFSLPIKRSQVNDSDLNNSINNTIINTIIIKMDPSLDEDEYELSIGINKIIIQGGANEGILYGIQTLRQIISQKVGVLPCIEIKDSPEIKNRGFYHDVTRGRIPTLDYLKTLADKLSYYKLNQLQLYVEHSYLFEDFSEVWRVGSPLTAEEIMDLDEYCRKLNIDLVPSLSSFGHLYELLRTKTYSHLCELEDSVDEPFSFIGRMEHHTIDISNEESFELITKIISEYMPLFTSQYFNICGDETFDLGKGRSKKLADQVGSQEMYVSFVKKLCNFVISKGKTPMIWGDIIAKTPEAIKELPSETICLNWGYGADQREDEAKAFAQVGANQYLCPGVSGWNQFINQYEVAYKNIKLMCGYCHKYEGIGVLNTNWGDFGHINHPEFSMAGLIYGGQFSWSKKDISFEEINKQISVLEYMDKSEEFMSIISNLAPLGVFDWRQIVEYKELHDKKDNQEEIEEFFIKQDLQGTKESNESIEKYINELYRILSYMDTSKRYLVKPYIIAGKGMYIFNQIGATIDELIYSRENKASAEPKQLAIDLEYWFHEYKDQWRRVSKESELYRIQDIINWYADYLRDTAI